VRQYSEKIVDAAVEATLVDSLNAYSQIGAGALTYDQNGNLTDDGGLLLAFDGLDRFVEAEDPGPGWCDRSATMPWGVGCAK